MVPTERQFERTVTLQSMRAVEAQQRMIQRAVVGITIVHGAITIVFTQRPAPGIRRLSGEALRQTFRHLDLQRVVRGAAGIGV